MSEGKPSRFANALTWIAVGLTAVLLTWGAVRYGFSLEVQKRFWTDIFERVGGPMTFRFILQPIMACIAAVPRLDFMQGELRWGQGILLPLAAGLLIIWAASQSGVSEWKAFLAFLLAGSFLFLVARRGHRR